MPGHMRAERPEFDQHRATARGQSGMTILLVEQNVRVAWALSDYAYVIAEGRPFMKGSCADLAQKSEIRRAYLEL